MALTLNPSNRLRRSPLFERVQAAGPKAWSVYNRTLIGQWYRSLEDDYAHLKSAVQVWDVGGERVVEVKGPDAERLIQMATPRDLSRLADDQCAYVPIVDGRGGMLNDPVLTRLGPDRFWLALADGDAGQYLKGLAAASRCAVDIFEPDVWIVAIQGPRADALIARVFGAEVTGMGFFRYRWVEVGGKPMVLARSGWSVQGGFELHVDGSDQALGIWDKLVEAGEDLDVRVGCPNLIERIEGGLLSYGNDMSVEHTPFEAGLDRFCAMDRDRGCVAHQILLKARVPKRQIRPIEILGPKVPAVAALWEVIAPDGQPAGKISSATWSPEFQTNVAIGMIDHRYWSTGKDLRVVAPDGNREAKVAEKFWGRS